MFVQGQVYSYVDTPVLYLNMKYFFFFSRLKKNDQSVKKYFLNVIVKSLLKGLGVG